MNIFNKETPFFWEQKNDLLAGFLSTECLIEVSSLFPKPTFASPENICQGEELFFVALCPKNGSSSEAALADIEVKHTFVERKRGSTEINDRERKTVDKRFSSVNIQADECPLDPNLAARF